MFQQEVEGNRLANRLAPQHSGIAPLLAAFRHGQRFYLLFPWAQGGSLKDLWQDYVPPGVELQVPPREAGPKCATATWYSDTWLLSECFRIADALAATQGFKNGTRDQNTPDVQFHSDVKPENILCFESRKERKQGFVLKLADFGEAQQVKAGEQPVMGMVPHVKTQRPPEDEPQAISLKYDVWCLGCVFLEFVTWALRGWHGCQSFQDERSREQDEPEVSQTIQVEDDLFFKRVKGKRILWPLANRETTKCIDTETGRATTRRSFWIASHVKVASQLKQNVATVSPRSLSFFNEGLRYLPRGT